MKILLTTGRQPALLASLKNEAAEATVRTRIRPEQVVTKARRIGVRDDRGHVDLDRAGVSAGRFDDLAADDRSVVVGVGARAYQERFAAATV